MVWKVFAPRFMAAAATSLIVDLAVIFGVGVGIRRIVDKALDIQHVQGSDLIYPRWLLGYYLFGYYLFSIEGIIHKL